MRMNSYLMRGLGLALTAVLVLGAGFAHAQESEGKKRKRNKSASEKANEIADEQMYQPIEYVNKAKPGPKVVVIPGDIKSANATFEQKVTVNNIADFGELELGMANFGILERADLGPMLDELTLAANMGDAEGLKKFKKGKFETTRWFIKFDILKAEQVAAVKHGFSGGALGSIAGSLIGGRAGSATDAGVSSIQTGQEAGVWIIGMRYKLLDASTSEQVSTGYKEMKMEVGAQSKAVLGIQRGTATGVGLDTMTQRLVQECVYEIDLKNK